MLTYVQGRAITKVVSHPPFTTEAGSVHAGFVVDKLALGQVFLRVPQFFHVYIIVP
jgi:hypothetical protein